MAYNQHIGIQAWPFNSKICYAFQCSHQNLIKFSIDYFRNWSIMFSYYILNVDRICSDSLSFSPHIGKFGLFSIFFSW